MGAESFADHLASLDQRSLIRLLETRPDVLVEPVPRGFVQLANRLSGAESLSTALRQVDRDGLRVGQAIAVLGGAASPSGVASLLGVPEAAARPVVERLCERGLAWRVGDAAHLPDLLCAHWSAELGECRPLNRLAGGVVVADLADALAAHGVAAAGLRKPQLVGRLAEVYDDVRALAAAVARLPEPARRRIDEIRHGAGFFYARGGGPAPSRLSDPTRTLLAAGLVLRASGRVELPRQVAVAAWLAEHDGDLTGAPAIPRPAVDGDRVRAVSGASARDAVHCVRELLDEAHNTPIAALKKGGVGARERTRLASRLSMPEQDVSLWLDLAYAAGLLDAGPAGYVPTSRYQDWRGAEPARRWAVLATTWLALEHAPTSRAIDGGKEHPPPLPLVSGAGVLRRALLGAVRDGGSVRAAVGHVDWFAPLSGYDEPLRTTRTTAAVREAELLGVVCSDVLSDLGARLMAVSGSRTAPALVLHDSVLDNLVAGCRELFPDTATSVVLQSDLTAVVAGELSPAASRMFADAAVAESRGAAATWRFSTASVRAALDVGWSAESLLAELRAVSARGVPRALEYLVNDVARRHGQVRVRGLRSCVLADEAVISEILHTRALAKLHLSRLAATVLGSPVEPGPTLAALRAAGFAPMAEDATGTVIVPSRAGHEAVSPPAAASETRARPAPRSATDLAAALAAGPRPPTEPLSGTAAVLAKLNRHLNDAEVDLLADAVDNGREICIAYRDKQGNRTVRDVTPRALYERWLDSWCHLRDGQRDFAVASIESVAPVLG